MVEEKNKESKEEKKEVSKENKEIKENKQEKETKKEEKKVEEKKEVKEEAEKKEEKKKAEKQVKPKKEFAVAKAYDLPISTKKAVAICKVIKGKHPKDAITLMEEVIKLKKAIPMTGEIPHRKKAHRLSKHAQGRYPVRAAKYFIKVLKQAIANASQVGLDEDKLYISIAKADKGSTVYRPGRFWGRKFKRTHLYFEIRQKP